MAPGPTEIEAVALAHGRAKKRNNAIAAFVSGVFPAVLLSLYLPSTWPRWTMGLILGLFWGNAFEYAYHRWLLHLPRSAFGKGHLRHHMTTGAPDEAEHVTLGSSALAVIAMFVINGVPLIAFDVLLRLGIAAPIMVGWTIYFILLEEVHWRVHLGPRLPAALRFAETYHLSHHDIPGGRFNVFFPICDLLLGSYTVPAPKVRSTI